MEVVDLQQLLQQGKIHGKLEVGSADACCQHMQHRHGQILRCQRPHRLQAYLRLNHSKWIAHPIPLLANILLLHHIQLGFHHRHRQGTHLRSFLHHLHSMPHVPQSEHGQISNDHAYSETLQLRAPYGFGQG